jgi:hypothetical protein
MANPNLLHPTTIYGKTAVQLVDTTATAIVSNPTASNKIYKINSLYVSCVDASDGQLDIILNKGGTDYRLGLNITVPVGSSIDVIAKHIYLEEGDSLKLEASVTSSLEAVCSYEEIS